MSELMSLYILTTIFFICSIIETHVLKVNVHKVATTRIRVSPKHILMLLPFLFILTLVFLIKGPKNFVQMYLLAVISLLVFGHSIFLTLQIQTRWKVTAFIIALLIICYRVIFPSVISHNLFLFCALLWLGPFFTKIGFMVSRRIFIGISIFLFIYDIIFVWLTPLSTELTSVTKAIGFPLALVSGGTFIGTGDLVYGNFLIALLKRIKLQFLAILFLVGSVALLDLYFFQFYNVTSFPLLVIWVPIGLFLLLLAYFDL